MFKRIFTAALVFGAAALAPPVASAQHVLFCAPRDAVVSQLESRFEERRVAMGLASAESLMEFWASDLHGSFTLLLTNTSGQTCVLLSGDHLVFEEPEPGGVRIKTNP